MKKIIIRIMFFVALISVFCTIEGEVVNAKGINKIENFNNKNPNSIKFIEDKNGIVIIKTITENGVIVDGKDSNKIELVNRIKEENGMNIDILVIRNTDLETEFFIRRMINSMNIKKIVVPNINNLNKNLVEYLKFKKISIIDMKMGFNSNVGNVELRGKCISGSNNEGMIFCSVDNIKVGFISKEMLKEIKKEKFIFNNKVDVLNIRGSNDFTRSEFREIVKELRPIKIIGNNENEIYYLKEAKKRGVKYYSLKNRGCLTIKRILGETKDFEII